jgi:hypothetical protein
MTNLSDTQRILLSTATQRDSGSLLPLPASLKPGGGMSKAISALVSRGFAIERETNDPTVARRSEGDIDYGVFVTPAGAEAIGIDLDDTGADADSHPGKAEPVIAAPPTSPSAPRASSKVAAVIALLTGADGATMPDLIAATGWLPHTTRAALTGLRRKGHTITRGKRDGVTCYRIVEAA